VYVGKGLLNGCYVDYSYNYYGPFNYVAAYDYYGYDTNVYGYYGGRYGGGNFYEHPGRGRGAGKYFYITVVDSCHFSWKQLFALLVIILTVDYRSCQTTYNKCPKQSDPI